MAKSAIHVNIDNLTLADYRLSQKLFSFYITGEDFTYLGALVSEKLPQKHWFTECPVDCQSLLAWWKTKTKQLTIAEGVWPLSNQSCHVKPAFLFCTSSIPSSLLSTLDCYLRNFLWGDTSYIHLLAWEKHVGCSNWEYCEHLNLLRISYGP